MATTRVGPTIGSPWRGDRTAPPGAPGVAVVAATGTGPPGLPSPPPPASSRTGGRLGAWHAFLAAGWPVDATRRDRREPHAAVHRPSTSRWGRGDSTISDQTPSETPHASCPAPNHTTAWIAGSPSSTAWIAGSPSCPVDGSREGDTRWHTDHGEGVADGDQMALCRGAVTKVSQPSSRWPPGGALVLPPGAAPKPNQTPTGLPIPRGPVTAVTDAESNRHGLRPYRCRST